MLAVGPQLVALQPNLGDTLFLSELRTSSLDASGVDKDGLVQLDAAPQQFKFIFDEGPAIDGTTIESGVRITRAGFDGSFGEANDRLVFPGHPLKPDAPFPGFFGVNPDEPNEIIIRFPEALPDDIYRVELFGAVGASGALADVNGDTFGLDDINRNFSFDLNLELPATIVSVVPEPITRNGDGTLTQAKDTILVYFNEDDDNFIEAVGGSEGSANDPEFYQLIFTNDTVTNADDQKVFPTSVTYDPDTDMVTLEFADDLDQLTTGSGTYRLRVGTNEPTPADPVPFDLLASVVTDMNAEGTELTFTANTHVGSGNPLIIDFVTADLSPTDPTPTILVDDRLVTVTLNSNTNALTMSQHVVDAFEANEQTHPLLLVERSAGLPLIDVTTPNLDGYTLWVVDPGSAFSTAFDVNAGLGINLSQEPVVISSEIESQWYGLEFPGADDELAHRPVSHVARRADQDPGVITLAYNFRPIIGTRTWANFAPAFNLITEVQKLRVREAFDIWSHYLGVQFIETRDQGFTIATGELEVIDPLVPSGIGDQLGLGDWSLSGLVVDPVLGLVPTAIMDAAEPWDDAFGASDDANETPSYFIEAMKQIGVLLGMVEQPAGVPEFPPLTIMQEYPPLEAAPGAPPGTPEYSLTQQPPEVDIFFGTPGVETVVEPVFPGDHDIVHGQHLHRPEGRDIDLYKFNLDQPGLLTLETFAERLNNSSLLDSVLTLYKFQPQTESYEIYSRNDDYFSEDSYIELFVEEGDYMVAVSSTGNIDFDPTIEDTGFGGTTEGKYDLRISFRPQVKPEDTIMETTGIAFDGDGDGVPQGVYNFWSRTEGDTRSLFLRGGGEMFEDGQRFTITDTNGFTVTFEFDNDFTTNAAFPITFDGTEDLPTLANQIADAISNHSLLSITTAVNDNRIELGGEAEVVIDPEFGAMGLHGKMIYVDKVAANLGDGTIDAPFRHIDDALDDAKFGDIVRIVGNGGRIREELDENNQPVLGEDGVTPLPYDPLNALPAAVLTPEDNLAYEIGFDVSQALPRPLQDGTTMDVPAGVTVQIDSGAMFKLRDASITAGTSSATVKRNAGALQVFGTPRVLDGAGNVVRDDDSLPVAGTVLFTSYDDQKNGEDTNPLIPKLFPDAGDWGGLIFRNDLDHDDELYTYDSQGIFLNHVNHADIRYGGGFVDVDSKPVINNPLHMRDARPTLTYNTITKSADAAMSANPDSFREDTFNAPEFQQDALFTSDYRRVGPEIHGNTLLTYRDDDDAPGVERHANTFNSLFIRTLTRAGQDIEELTVSARWDDTDIVHTVAENLFIAGTPGGPLGDPNRVFNAVPEEDPGIEQVIPEVDYADYAAVDEIDYQLIARLDASLVIDPRIVVKLSGSRIEASQGAQLVAEGLSAQEVIFTSGADDRYGAGGIFDTSNDGEARTALPGDWGGIVFMHLSQGSIDQALVAFGGGSTRIEGEFASVNAVEIHQSEVRLTNTLFEENADGHGVNENSSRLGRGFNDPATIYIRGSQPIIVDNTFQNNGLLLNDPLWDELTTEYPAPVISVNANALNSRYVKDRGRSTGMIDLMIDSNGSIVGEDNQGPLVERNRLSLYSATDMSDFTDLPQNRDQLNGMLVRPHTLTTEVVWDDTSIAHVIYDEIYVPNFHSYGGLRIESNAKGSLIVKLAEKQTVDPDDGTVTTTIGAITVGGDPTNIHDRAGGRLHIVGHGGFPVVFTSLADDTVTAGLDPKLRPVGDTNSDGDATQAEPGDWRSIRIDEYAHDRNVDVYTEQESPVVDPPTPTKPTGNSIPSQAEYLGLLAPHERGGDDNQRLGFEVHGIINHPSDIDIYSFEARAGTEIWVDLDRTAHDFDPILELIGTNGDVLARSDKSVAEDIGYEAVFETPSVDANPMRKTAFSTRDSYGLNAFDPGMRLILPGAPESINTYHVRIRSSSRELLADTPDHDADLYGGLTGGTYEMQIRLQEDNEIAGTSVQFADIRFAQNGIEVFGQPTHSPLTGEAIEDVTPNNTFANAQYIGSLTSSDRHVISVNGALDIEYNPAFPDDPANAFTEVDWHDIDWYRATLGGSVTIDVDYASGIGRPSTNVWVFDSTGALVAASNNSLIQEDVPAPLEQASDLFHDHSRGTISASDPFLGPIDLPTGEYFIAVTPFFRSPSEVGNFGTIVEPIDSIGRIVEDHLEFPSPADPEAFPPGSFTPASYWPAPLPTPIPPGGAASPIFNVLAPQGVSTWEYPQMGFYDEVKGRPHPFIDTISPVEYHLGDVVLFASTDPITIGNNSGIWTVNPFTGTVETWPGDFPELVNDINIRGINLYAFEDGTNVGPYPPNDANSGHLIEISSADATSTDLGDDGIETYMEDIPANPGEAIRTHLTPQGDRVGDGIQFQAIEYFGPLQERWLAVGNRGFAFNPAGSQPFLPGIEYDSNILYQHEIGTGLAFSDPPEPATDRPDGAGETLFDGAGTNIRERGEILTAPKISLRDNIDLDNDFGTYGSESLDVTMLDFDLTTTRHQLQNTLFALVDGTTLTVEVDGQFTTFEFDTGPDVIQEVDILNDESVRDGQFFFLDPDELATNDEVLFQLDTGAVIQVTADGGGINDGQTIAVDAAAQNAPTLTFEFDKDGELVGQGNVAVSINNNMGSVSVAGALAAAINAAGWAPGDVKASAAAQRITVAGDFAISVGPGSNGIVLEGDAGEAPILQLFEGAQLRDEGTFELSTRSNLGNPTIFEFDSGWMLEVPGAGGANFTDTDFFRVVDTDPLTAADVVFEFENATTGDGGVDGTYPGATQVILVPYNTTDRQDAVSVAIAAAVQGSTLNLDFDNGIVPAPPVPQAFENGIVWLGGDEFVTVTDASEMAIVGQFGVTDPTHARVPYLQTRAFTLGMTGQNIDNAITNTGVSFAPLVVTDGGRYLGNSYQVDDDGTTMNLVLVDQNNMPPGLPPANTYWVPFDPGDPNADPVVPPTDVEIIATTMAGVITANAATLNATAPGFGGLVTLTPKTGSLQAFSDLYGDKLVVNGDGILFIPGSSPINKFNVYSQIPLEEITTEPGTDVNGDPITIDLTVQSIGEAVANAVDAHPLFDAGGGYTNLPQPAGIPNYLRGAGARISFLGAQSGDFSAVPVWNDDADFDGSPTFGGVAPTHVSIGITADERGEEVRDKIAAAINGALRPSAFAWTTADTVRLSRGSVTIDENGPASGFLTAGEGPGGMVTGITIAGDGALYAISDRGGLYRVTNYLGDYHPAAGFPGAQTTYIGSSADDLEGIPFSSLEAGPPTVEGGRYANMLFAFAEVPDEFGFLETRLYAFDLTGELQPIFVNGQTSLDVALPPGTDGLVFSTLDENLWHFEGDGATPDYVIEVPPTESRNRFQGGATPTAGFHWQFGPYDYAGGAYGELVSNEFSLVGYSPDDQPTLYFSFYNDQGAEGFDSFLVYAAANGGNWVPLGEFGDTGGNYSQAVVGLDSMAGEDNVRVKFVFTTAGTMNVGDPFTVGEEIRTISGAELIDGESMQILTVDGDLLTLEVDLGYNLVTPSGGRIVEGETVSIEGISGDISTFEFDNDGILGDSYSVPDPVQIAQNLQDGGTVELVLSGNTDQTVELDTGIVLRPTAGDVQDGHMLRVVATNGVEYYFEFDGDFVTNELIAIFDNGLIAVGETFTIDNRIDPAVTFEFGPGSGTNVPVAIGGSEAATAQNMATAINNSAIGGPVGARVVGPNNNLLQLFRSNVFFTETIAGIAPIGVNVGVGTGAARAHRFVQFSPTSTTQDELADSIAIAFGNTLPTIAHGELVEGNDTLPNAAESLLGQSGTTDFEAFGNIGLDAGTNFRDVDLVEIPMTAGDMIDISLTPAIGFDGYIRVFATDGAEWAESADVAANPNIPDLTFTATTTGVYYVGISAEENTDYDPFVAQSGTATAGSTGGYNLDVTFTSGQGRGVGNGLLQLGNALQLADVGDMPNYTVTGTPGVAVGNLPLPYAPAVDRDGLQLASQIGGLINIHAGADSVDVQGRLLLPADADNNTIGGSLGLAATGNIAVAYDERWTASEVARELLREIRANLPTGVDVIMVPRHEIEGNNGSTHPENFITTELAGDFRPDGTLILEDRNLTNQLNLPGATLVSQSPAPGTAVAQIQIRGRAGVLEGNIPIPVESDWDRIEVADSLDAVLEAELADDQVLIVEDGSNYDDGDWFRITDNFGTSVFEFETGYVLNVPDAGGSQSTGGIADGDTFELTDGIDTYAFEFDSDRIINDVIVVNNRHAILDGHTFTLDEDVNGPFVFEFDDVPDPTNPPAPTLNDPAAFPVFFTQGFSSDNEIAIAIQQAINNASISLSELNPDGTVDTQTLIAEASPLTANGRGGDRVHLRGLQLDPRKDGGGIVPGSPGLAVVDIERLFLTDLIVVGGVEKFADGDFFRIIEPAIYQNPRSVTFEFNDISVGTVLQVAGSIPVNYDPAVDTSTDIALAIANAIDAANINGRLRGISAAPTGANNTAVEIIQNQPTFDITAVPGLSSANGLISVDDVSLLVDEQLFTVTEAAGTPNQQTVTFEFRNLLLGPGMADIANHVPVDFLPTDAPEDVLASMINAINASRLRGINASSEGPASLAIELVAAADVDVLAAPALRLTNVTAGRNVVGPNLEQLTVEIVTISGSSTGLAVAQAIASTVSQAALPFGATIDAFPFLISPTVMSEINDSRVQLRGGVGLELAINSNTLALTGTPGVDPTHVEVAITPGSVFTAADVATEVTAAINGSSLFLFATQEEPPRRIALNPFFLTPTNLAQIDANGLPLQLDSVTDVVKQDEDLIRFIMDTVIDPGPFGYDFFLPSPPDFSFYSAVRGVDNAHAGVFIDDIIIGFAERGQMVTGADPNTGFNPPPDPRPVNFNNGSYQLEIRDGAPYMIRGAVTPLFRTFDTNDRLDNTFVLELPTGAEIVDGQEFALGDGLNEVVFQYRDITPAALQPGHDTLLEALDTGIRAGKDDFVRFYGEIGDNPEMAVPEAEVDVVSLEVDAGAIFSVDIDANSLGSILDAGLRVFYDDGLNIQQLAFNDDDDVPRAPGEQASSDPYLLIQAPYDGTYYIAISGASNFTYDPELEGSGSFGSTGFYELEIIVGDDGGVLPTVIPFDATDADWEITQRVRDVINGVEIQGIIDPFTGEIIEQRIDVQAANWDGASLIQTSSTAGRLNLFGPAVHVGTVHTDLLQEGNDTIDTAIVAAVVPGAPGDWLGIGKIGDNPELAERHELDVDFIALDMAFGEELVIDIDSATDTPLNPEVYLFSVDTQGTPQPDDDVVVRVEPYNPEIDLLTGINLNDDHMQFTLNEIFVETDSYIEFSFDATQLFPWETADTSTVRRFYIGISAHDNQPALFREDYALDGGYDPEVAGTGDFINAISSGEYQVHIKVGNGAVPFWQFEEGGPANRLDDPNRTNSERTVIGQMMADPNRFRDQGQIILHGNRIMDSEDFGILVAPGLRTGDDNSIPHSGPVRTTREINSDNLTTGVTITNNIIAFSGSGGILYSGDPNTSLGGDGPAGAVPHGRIINNTLFGVGGTDYSGTQDWVITADQGADIAEGDAFQITDAAGNQVIFEFDSDGSITGDVPVPFTAADTADTVAASMAAAINGAAANGLLVGVAATANGPDVTITGVADITGIGSQMVRLAVDAGVFILNNASPTVMNNIIANFDFGIAIDTATSDVILGGSLYADNLTNAGDPFGNTIPLGEFSLNLDDEPNKTLFVNPANRNFYLDSGSLAIDSSIDSIEERFELNTVKAPMGIPPSPMLAPNTDQAGLRREDDPNVDTPGGVGDNLFKDRGALDRVDFTGPVALLVAPEDNDANGIDRNDREGYVDIVGEPVSQFVIQLQDKTDAVDGIGIDDTTVNPGVVAITHDGQPMQEGTDYRFEYDATNDSILFNPQAGIFEPGEYIITIANEVQLFIDAPAGADVTDGETFQLTDPFGNQVIFEWNDPNVDPALTDDANHAVFYDPTWTPTEMAQAIAAAINQAVAANTLVGIAPNLQATSVGIGNPDEVTFGGLPTHTEGGVTDLANNSLKPNTNDNQTMFVINITSERDFGDAPDTTQFDPWPVSYNTFEDNAGAFHYFFTGFRLGDTFDFEIDGQASGDATGDGSDEDGVSFPNGFYATYTSKVLVDVNIAPEIVQDAYVDGWIDFNQNGMWEDTLGEHVIHEIVDTGMHEFDVTVPADVTVGDTFARFRLSTEPDLGPTGEGGLGEVEDYQVRVGPQYPWHNVANPGDVNDTGNITTTDFLALHSFFYVHGPAPVPAPGEDPLPGWPTPLPGDPTGTPPFPISGPAPYYDVDGDNYVGLSDLVALARMSLDTPPVPPPAPEGEGSGAPARHSLPPEGEVGTAMLSQPIIEVTGISTTPAAEFPAEVTPASSTVVAVGMIVDSSANSLYSAEDGSATAVEAGPRTDLVSVSRESAPASYGSLVSIVDALIAERASQAPIGEVADDALVDAGVLAVLSETEFDAEQIDEAVSDMTDGNSELTDDVLGTLLNQVLDE